ncbi:MAG: hypothetical protein ACR2PA_07670 [Hyphomicrobiaceae bacterium]
MTEDMDTINEREEIEMLLPWYASGRLDRTDHDRVERFLANHPEMRQQLQLINAERDEAIAGNEALGAPSAASLNRLRDAIAAETPEPSKLAAVSRGLWQEFAALFSNPTPRAVQWAGAAAALLLIAQAGVIGALVGPGSTPSGGYSTASGTTSDGTVLIVRFAPAATAEGIAKALGSVKGQIVSGPKPGNLFEVIVPLKSSDKAKQDALITKLKGDAKTVTLVLPKG